MRFFKICFSFFLTLGSLIPVVGSAAEAENSSLDIRIPVVDMNDFYLPAKREAFLATLYDAMTTVGFFAVRNTGVNADIIREAYSQAAAFFKSDPAFKATCIAERMKGQRGFVPGETAKGNNVKDFKEFYHFGREGFNPPNVWPEQAGFKEAIVALFNELEQYVIPLQQAIIATIKLKTNADLSLDLLNQTTAVGDSILRSLYYPAVNQEALQQLKQPLYWAAPHTDIDLLAILPFATEKGLQVEVNGQWLNVVVPSDAFVVNVGDMLENLTNGLFKSAKHRVLALEPNKDRFSMVFFVHPTDETRLDPLPACIELTGGTQKYAAGTRAEFLWERLLELGIAPGLLSAYAQTGHAERQMQFGKESPQVVEMLIKNNLASNELIKAAQAKGAQYFSTTRPCGCK